MAQLNHANIRHCKRTFVQQTERSDCGIACLRSIIRYYGGDASIESLRQMSGTSPQGTTLLGLSQAANHQGLEPKGFQGDLNSLSNMEGPCILHVNPDSHSNHYILVYGFDGKDFIIGDPATRIEKWNPSRLQEIWKTNLLLSLKPDNRFQGNPVERNPHYRWICNLLREDRTVLFLVALAGILVSALGLSITIYLQVFIDNILPASDPKKLIPGLVLVLVLLCIRGFLNLLRGMLSNQQNKEFSKRLITAFYDRLLLLPKSFFNSRKTGELIARMDDTQRIQLLISYLISEFCIDLFLVSLSTSLIFYYSKDLGWICLIGVSLFSTVFFVTSKNLKKDQFEVMSANARKTGNYTNTIQGVDSIKLLNKETYFTRINTAVYGIFQDKIWSLGNRSIHLQLYLDLVSTGITVFVLAVAGYKVFHGHLSIGELTAIISLTGNLFPKVAGIAFANIRFQGAKVALIRIREFMDLKTEYQSPDNGVCCQKLQIQVLQARQIAYAYPGQPLLIKEFSITIRMNQIAAIMGESGCGKTTFLNILQKFYPPEDGFLTVNGIPFQEIPHEQWRNMIGVVPQEIALFNGSLLENICISSNPADLERAYHLSVSLGFDPYFKKLPNSYATLLGENGIVPSMGQKQLLSILRALFRKPQLLLLDEPISAMDADTADFIMRLLSSLRKEMGLLLVTHDPKLAGLADCIYIMENGRSGGFGSPRKLMRSNNLYSRAVLKSPSC